MSKVTKSIQLDPILGDPPSPGLGELWLESGSGQLRFKDGIGVADVRAGGGEQAKVSADDTVSGYLEDKVKPGDGTISINVVNPGANEHLAIAANITETFLAQEIESAAAISTTSTAAVDAFAGASLLVPSGGDGDWLVLFESDARMTNANIEGSIAVGKSGINEVAGSIRIFGGNQRGSAIVIKALPGLVAGDTIHGVYKKIAGLGSAELFNRSLTAFRIG